MAPILWILWVRSIRGFLDCGSLHNKQWPVAIQYRSMNILNLWKAVLVTCIDNESGSKIKTFKTITMLTSCFCVSSLISWLAVLALVRSSYCDKHSVDTGPCGQFQVWNEEVTEPCSEPGGHSVNRVNINIIWYTPEFTEYSDMGHHCNVV